MKLHSHKSLQHGTFWQAAILFFTAAIAFGWLGFLLQPLPRPNRLPPAQGTPETTLTQPVPAPITRLETPLPIAPQTTAQVYWLQTNPHNIQLQPQTLSFAPNTAPIERLRYAIELLLNASANPAKPSSTIPTNTRLLHLKQDGKRIYVDLSAEFAHGGGSSSMIYRVAQILYTATSITPDAQVYLTIEGQPLDEAHPLGGEGLLLPSPLTRQQLAAELNQM
jgi:Sporulation and spore germination